MFIRGCIYPVLRPAEGQMILRQLEGHNYTFYMKEIPCVHDKCKKTNIWCHSHNVYQMLYMLKLFTLIIHTFMQA